MRKLPIALAFAALSVSADKVENLSPCAPFTVKEMVEILTEYDIQRASVPPLGFPFQQHVLGVTNYETKKIFLNDIYTEDLQQQAVVHEFYHVMHKKRGYDNSESTIRRCSEKAYEAMK